MIITRSPLRVTLGGGGTDLPSYYKNHEGFLISAAINKYVYITINQNFTDSLIVKYSETERVTHASELKHPIIREAFDLVGLDGKFLEVTCMADIPVGTGLGSSGSFTTALLKALHQVKKNIVGKQELAEQACHIEIERLGEPSGKQDQYIAAFGGVTCFRFRRDGEVDIDPLRMTEENMANLEDNLMLFFTGYSRRSSSILTEQDKKTKDGDSKMVSNLHYVKEMGLKSRSLLETGNLSDFGRLMHEHWGYKKHRSGNMSNLQIDHWYDTAMRNGALGGKLIGAGGGGFLMFYTEDRMRLRHSLLEQGLREVRFFFDTEGTEVLVS